MSYYDTTVMKSNTLLPEHQNIMTHLDGKVTITTYVNLLDRDAGIGLPSNVMWDMERFKDYIRFKPDIKMKYIYYYDGARGISFREANRTGGWTKNFLAFI